MVGVAEINYGGLQAFAQDGMVTCANARARNRIFYL
jgi:hypothetical protein